MQVVSTVQEFRDFCRAAPRPLGLVPTMGALHDGHLSLVSHARQECAAVAVTIFVNPTQFAPHEDLDRYPRTVDRDLQLLEEAGTDVVFLPSTEEVYPPGSATTMTVRGPALSLEGEARPGYFDGMATVVTKLLLMALPDVAYWGQKDGQQVAVVRRLVADLNIPVQLRVVPTVREPDGLAMSSRNAYLTAQDRDAASVVYRALQAAQRLYGQGERRREALEGACRALLESEPLVRIDYVALVDPDSFAPVSGTGVPSLLTVAVEIGSTRLIDNVLLGKARGEAGPE